MNDTLATVGLYVAVVLVATAFLAGFTIGRTRRRPAVAVLGSSAPIVPSEAPSTPAPRPLRVPPRPEVIRSPLPHPPLRPTASTGRHHKPDGVHGPGFSVPEATRALPVVPPRSTVGGQ